MNAHSTLGTRKERSSAPDEHTAAGAAEIGERVREIRQAPRGAAPGEDVALIGLCEIAQLLGEQLPPIEPFMVERFAVKRLRRRQCLQRAGERFSTIFVVQSGALMSSLSDCEGTEQVLAFPMCGDVVGLDGIGEDRVVSDAIALDTSRVVAIVFSQLAQLSRAHIGLQRMVYRLFARELTRQRAMLRMLGSSSADARVAHFLLELSRRHERLGVASGEFMLPMRRLDMARYLGLQLETVSRAMSSLDQLGVLAVEGKRVRIRDWDSLRRIADCSARHVHRVT